MFCSWSTRRVLVVLLACASFSLAVLENPVRADRKEDAAKDADLGDRAFSKGDFGKALESYQASFGRYPKPFLIFRIAECQRQLGKIAEALGSYKKYVAKVTKGADRKKAESYVSQLEQTVEAQATDVDKPAAPVTPVTQAPDVEAPPMRAAEVKAAKNKKGPPPITTATAPKADVVPPGYDPSAPPPDPTAPYVDGADRQPSGPKPIYKKWWLWTAVVGGAAVIGVGLGVGLTLGLPKFASELPVGGPGATSSGLAVRF